jgi:hypothetical protein
MVDVTFDGHVLAARDAGVHVGATIEPGASFIFISLDCSPAVWVGLGVTEAATTGIDVSPGGRVEIFPVLDEAGRYLHAIAIHTDEDEVHVDCASPPWQLRPVVRFAAPPHRIVGLLQEGNMTFFDVARSPRDHLVGELRKEQRVGLVAKPGSLEDALNDAIGPSRTALDATVGGPLAKACGCCLSTGSSITVPCGHWVCNACAPQLIRCGRCSAWVDRVVFVFRP